jgi:hypothetical protein
MPANAAIVTLNVKTFVLSANGKCTVDSIVVTDPGPGGPENKARVVYRNGVLYFKNRGNSSLSVQFVITSTDTNAPTIKATGITLPWIQTEVVIFPSTVG